LFNDPFEKGKSPIFCFFDGDSVCQGDRRDFGNNDENIKHFFHFSHSYIKLTLVLLKWIGGFEILEFDLQFQA